MGPLQRKRQTEREKKKERNPSSFFLSEPKKCRWCKKKKESGGEGGCFLFRALPQQMFSGTGGRRGQTVKISKTLSCSSCLSLFYMPSALLSSCEKACLRPPLPPPPQKKRIIFLGRIRQVEKKERERERKERKHKGRILQQEEGRLQRKGRTLRHPLMLYLLGTHCYTFYKDSYAKKWH